VSSDPDLPQTVYAWVREQLGAQGFDLCAQLAVSEQLCAPVQLDRFGLSAAWGMVIANSKALWPAFEIARSISPGGALQLDAYTEHTLAAVARSACAQFGLPHTWALYFSHHTYPTSSGTHSPLALQRLVELAGLAALGPAHLNVHPRFGPWIGLRALLVLPLQPAVLCAPEKGSSGGAPCQHCDTKPCLPALQRALQTRPDDRERWQHWLAVRDACPIGREQRYSEAQIRFHYASLGAPPLRGPERPNQS
jgi:hypothetical protein